MSKYMMIYRGEATDMSEMTEAQANEVVAKWGEWMGKVGDALVDIGAPFGGGMSLVDDGTTGEPVSLSGYSIVEADDLAGAKKAAEGHPYLSDGAGNYSIEIFEMMPVPFE